MYVNLRLFFKAEAIALLDRPFRLRRWAFVGFFTGLYWFMWCLIAVGRLLDHVFFPGFRRQEIHEPVFIIAPPRSGTTFAQNLLSLDEERFAHLKLYQTIFPSVCFQRLFDALAWVDRHTFRILSRLLAWFERRIFGGWDDMHPLRFNAPEEDDGLFVYTFVTEAILLLFPYTQELWEAGFADSLPADDRRRLMRYYRSCIKRHLYANGPHKTFLSKSTQSSGAIESVREEFPDARILTIIRHPYQSIASHVSVFYPVWRAHSPEIAKSSPESEAYAELAVAWYRHVHEVGANLDGNRFIRIRYTELVEDPRGTIEQVYGRLGFELTPEFRERLQAATRESRSFRSNHEYSLEEFGLSEQWIQERLGDVMDAYSLDRKGP